jgi:hypothetical protein
VLLSVAYSHGCDDDGDGSALTPSYGCRLCLLTSWSAVLFEKLMIAQLLEKFSVFMEPESVHESSRVWGRVQHVGFL